MEAKATDFRIGNYYNQFGYYERVSWNTLKNLENATKEQLWFRPALLSEEILLKCPQFKAMKDRKPGFWFDLKDESDLSFRYFQGNIELWNNDFIKKFSGIKLHEFQNLFKSVTQTELEINL